MLTILSLVFQSKRPFLSFIAPLKVLRSFHQTSPIPHPRQFSLPPPPPPTPLGITPTQFPFITPSSFPPHRKRLPSSPEKEFPRSPFLQELFLPSSPVCTKHNPGFRPLKGAPFSPPLNIICFDLPFALTFSFFLGSACPQKRHGPGFFLIFVPL